MARAYSLDLRERVVAAVAAGQSCRSVGIYYTNFDRNLSSLIIGVMLLIAVLMNNTFRKMAVNYVGRKPAVTFAVAKKGIA